MKPQLRILMLEDNAVDAELITSTLEEEGIFFEATRLETEKDFLSALQGSAFDLILSDCSLPSFDGLAALKIARKIAPEVPFIFVSGTIGEEVAVETLKNGATDYVLKQRLARLGAAVRRAVAETEERAARKELEQRFVEAQKMEVVGRLAAGVAHDFNNLLTVINGYSDVLLAQVAPGDSTHRELEEIRSAGDRAAKLTQRLLSFSRRQQVEVPVEIDLNKVVSGLSNMLQRISGEDVRLVIDLDPDAGSIEANETQMEQIVINLVINARDAMPGGGEIRVVTKRLSGNDAPAEGNWVALEVTDTGHGMDAATASRIFEPFFTTKEVGRGTGLGLWMVHEAVRNSGGSIAVKSEVGQGTEFQIRLPRIHDRLASVSPVTVASDTPGERKTILLVEDEDAVRDLLAQTLDSAGYRVWVARNAAEALAIAEQDDPEIHLLVTDIAMPGIGGMELAAHLVTSHPELRVLCMSGYADYDMNQTGASSDWTLLQKPFAGDAFLKAVRESLDRGRKRIVVADDDPSVRAFVSDILRLAGYLVSEASNGKEAVQIVRRENIDLLITDLVMPDQEGIETIKMLRKEFSSLPLIAMSGAVRSSYLEVARHLGATEVLAKPFASDTLREAVERLLPKGQERSTQPAA